MDETLQPLVVRALQENVRPLEFFLREQSHLPGRRANLKLVDDVSDLLAEVVSTRPEEVRRVIEHLTRDAKRLEVNTPGEFVVLCGVVALGMCASVYPLWRQEVIARLSSFAANASWRVREGVAIAFQRLLEVAPEETSACLRIWAEEGNCWQQRASVAAIAEPPLMSDAVVRDAAFEIQQVVVRRFHALSLAERKCEYARVLRQALGYALSVMTAALPEQGFALMRECASWNDADINWIVRENLKKKRLAKFNEQVEQLVRML